MKMWGHCPYQKQFTFSKNAQKGEQSHYMYSEWNERVQLLSKRAFSLIHSEWVDYRSEIVMNENDIITLSTVQIFECEHEKCERNHDTSQMSFRLI